MAGQMPVCFGRARILSNGIVPVVFKSSTYETLLHLDCCVTLFIWAEIFMTFAQMVMLSY